MTYDAQTPRRSRRYQPLVSNAAASEDEEEISWLGIPIYERETRATDLHEEDTFDSDTELQTTFYNGFSKQTPLSASGLSKGPGRSKRLVEEKSKFYIGDTVLVKTQAKLPSIGVIIAIWEVHAKDDDDDEAANTRSRRKGKGEEEDEEEEGVPKVYQKVKVQWFLRPSELPSVRARRDHFQNEIYYSLASTATLSPQAIYKLCKVSSEKSFKKDGVSVEFTKSSSKKVRQGDNIEEYYCGSAIDARRGLYYKIAWEKHREDAMEADEDLEGGPWAVTVVPKGRKNAVKRHDPDKNSEEDVDSEDEYDASSNGEDPDEEDEAPDSDRDSVLDNNENNNERSGSEGEDDENPFLRISSRNSRKRKTAGGRTISQPATPRRKRRISSTVAAPTPHSRAALRARERAKKTKRKAAFRPAPQIEYGFMNATAGTLPDDPWLRVMQVFHVGSRPDVLPCREAEFLHILRSVEGLLEEGSGGCVYVSGVPGTGKTATVHRIVRELKRMAERNEANPFTYVEINGLKIPEASAAYTLLWEAVSGHDVTTDGHLRISSKEALKQLTKYFGAGARAGPAGHACIVLMDELDQLLTTKQEVVYNFFNWPTLAGSKLIVIAVANTHDLPERVMTGRVRSRLGMTRINYQPYDKAQLGKIVHARLQAAQEGFTGDFPEVITADAINFAAAKVASISGDARRVLDICRRAVEFVRSSRKPAKIPDVKEVITRMQSSLTAAYLSDCSLHERIMLASLIKCILRSGVLEVSWDEIQRQHLIYTPVLAGDESIRKPSVSELRIIRDGLLASHAMLIEGTGVACVARKPEGERKILLNIEQIEVQRVLSEMGGHQWKTALGL